LEDLVRFPDEEILSLHGMGPTAINQLRSALRSSGTDWLVSQRCDSLIAVHADTVLAELLIAAAGPKRSA
jgi:hypothetical protein